MVLVFLPPSRPLVARRVGVLALRARDRSVWSWGQRSGMVRSSRAIAAGWSSCTRRGRWPPSSAAGGRRPAAGGDRGTGTLHAHWWHLWLPGIPLPARAPSMGRRRPGGLGPARTLHGTWRTAEGPRQLRWRAQHGAEAAPELGGGVGGGAGAAPGDEAVGPDQQRSPVGGRRVGGPWRPWMRTNHPRKGDAPPPAHSGASGGRWRPAALGPRAG